jgi:hypothetical protein
MPSRCVVNLAVRVTRVNICEAWRRRVSPLQIGHNYFSLDFYGKIVSVTAVLVAAQQEVSDGEVQEEVKSSGR